MRRYLSKSWFLLHLILVFSTLGCHKKDPVRPVESAPVLPFRIQFPGVGAHGIFDPSLAKDPVSSRVWMSYSAVDPSVLWPTENPRVVSTRLAFSDDQGASWSDSGGIVNPTNDVTLPLVAPLNAGTWQNEVSSLVFDPGAPAQQRWKLLWHHYLVINDQRSLAEHSWLGLKMASTPGDLASATELKLFTAHGYDSANNTAGGLTGSPLGGAPVVALDTAFPVLSTGVFSEPGLMATSNALYLSLLCVNASSQHLISLLKCGSPCDPTNPSAWSYVGTLLRDSDGVTFGADQGFSAPALFQSGGNTYLIVTPVSSTPFDSYYNGCVVYRFTDLDAGTLNLTQPAGEVQGIAGSFHGAGTYLPQATGSGLIYSQLFSLNDFGIVASRVGF
jgi:hypothetical protein